MMGDLIFPDFQTKDRRYTKGGGIDDLGFTETTVYGVGVADVAEMRRLVAQQNATLDWLNTAPCEMPPVQPSYTAPEQDPA